MKQCMVVAGLLCVVLSSTPVMGANSVVVQSKTVSAGALDVPIGIRVTNELALAGLVVPLKVRQVTPGSFITRLAMSWGGRLDSVMTDVVINHQYATENYNCGRGGIGFADIVASSADSSRAVGTSPAGVLFVRVEIFSPALPAGADVEPSMRLIVSVTGTPGTFEIDTTCTVQANHLQFMRDYVYGGEPYGVVPAFTKGIITIAPCDCAHHGDPNDDGVIDVFDVSFLIDYIFSGTPVPPKDSSCPHIDRGDVNCDGVDDILDIVYLCDYVFSGGPAPCNPCACSQYPTNCP